MWKSLSVKIILSCWRLSIQLDVWQKVQRNDRNMFLSQKKNFIHSRLTWEVNERWTRVGERKWKKVRFDSQRQNRKRSEEHKQRQTERQRWAETVGSPENLIMTGCELDSLTDGPRARLKGASASSEGREEEEEGGRKVCVCGGGFGGLRRQVSTAACGGVKMCKNV